MAWLSIQMDSDPRRTNAWLYSFQLLMWCFDLPIYCAR